MSTFRIGRTEHVTLGNDGIDSKVDAFIRELRGDLTLTTDALRDTLIYFATSDIEAEDQAAEETQDEQNAARAERRELENRADEAESAFRAEVRKTETLQRRCQELLQENAALRLEKRDNRVDLDAILESNPDVIRVAFGDNKTIAYKLYCRASQLDEQDPHEGIRLYERALQLDPKLALAWTNLGNCYHRLDRTERALSCFRKAIEVEPRQTEAHFNIATVLLESGSDNREVEIQLKLAIDCDPRFADAYYALGAMYVRKAEAAKAKTYLEQYLKLEPKSIYAEQVRKMLKGERQ